MNIDNLNLRNVFAIAICLAEMTLFTGCDKDEPPKDPLTYDKGVMINGVKWATRNVDEVGTFALTPESAGKFYQWNRKKAWSATSATVENWDSSMPEGTEWSKVNNPCPTGWRVPTSDEIQTLLNIDKVNNEWTTQNGINGRKFTDKATGNTLFLPAAGSRWGNGTLVWVGNEGLYWSSTFGCDACNWSFILGFNNANAVSTLNARVCCSVVRAVAE